MGSQFRTLKNCQIAIFIRVSTVKLMVYIKWYSLALHTTPITACPIVNQLTRIYSRTLLRMNQSPTNPLDLTLHPWKIISGLEVGLYSTYFLIAAYPIYIVFHLAYRRFTRVVNVLTLLYLTRIVAGALLLATLDGKDDWEQMKYVNMIIASAVFVSLAPGFLVAITFKVLQYINHYDRDDHNAPKKLLTLLQLIDAVKSGRVMNIMEAGFWYLVTTTIVLSAVGNGIIHSNFNTATRIVKAASVLYSLVFAIFLTLLLITWRQFLRVGKYRRYLSEMLVLCSVVAMFLVVRIVAYVCTAFTLDTGAYGVAESKFAYLFGNWKLYAFLTFMPEVICAGIWVRLIWCLALHLKREDHHVPVLDDEETVADNEAHSVNTKRKSHDQESKATEMESR